MTRWSHVPTWHDHKPDTDRTVLRDGYVVGRVHQTITAHDGDMWEWAVQTYPASSGKVGTLAEALDKVRAGASDRFATPPRRK